MSSNELNPTEEATREAAGKDRVDTLVTCSVIIPYSYSAPGQPLTQESMIHAPSIRSHASWPWRTLPPLPSVA
jgi:hypothetical protein